MAKSPMAKSHSGSGHGAADPLPAVHVNKADLGEIKGALDDIVKRHLQEQAFTPSLVHPTVHLCLGYASVLFALGSALWTFRTPFEESKPALWVGVVGYFALQTALWAWKRWVEKGEVFRGRRRRMVKRIETDHVQIISSTTLDPPLAPAVSHSPHTRPASPATSSPASPASPFSLPNSDFNHHEPSASPSSPRSPIPSSNSSLSAAPSDKIVTLAPSHSSTGPTYVLHLNLSTTSNKGKSLIRQSRVVAGRGIGELIDSDGGVEEGEVARWIGSLLVDAGLVGAEEEGTKEE